MSEESETNERKEYQVRDNDDHYSQGVPNDQEYSLPRFPQQSYKEDQDEIRNDLLCGCSMIIHSNGKQIAGH